MRINNIVFCDSAQQLPLPQGGAVTVLNKPLPSITSEFIPGLYSMTVSFGISDFSDQGPKKMKASFFDDENREAFSLESNMDEMRIAKEALKEGLTCCIDLRNVKLMKEGVYTLQIELDGIVKKEQISVRKRNV